MTGPDALAHPPAAAGIAERVRAARAWIARNAQAAAATALAPVAATTILLGATSDHLAHPWGAALYTTYLVVAPVLVGLVWWRRRPASRLGPLLVALGYASWPISWQGSDRPFLYNLGVLGTAVPIAMSLYLCLAFSTGRLRTDADRLLLGLLGGVLLLFYGTALLFAPALAGDGPLAACAVPCPANPFQIDSRPQLLEAVATTVTYVGLAVVAGIAAVWIRRFRAATGPQRRALAPVAATSLLLVPALFAFYFAVLVVGVDAGTFEALSWILTGIWILFPVGFAVALLQADLFAGRAFQELISELANRPTPARWRDIVAGALGDRSLRLGYWDTGSARFRDADGVELAPPADGSSRGWTEVRRDGLPVAALDTDAALAEDPELVEVAASATLLAIETGRLEGELRAAQARAIAAADGERRRIGRDLHDSAQQRLVALRVHLSLAGEQIRPDELPIVEELERELDAALGELQSVARGLFPNLLAQHGLAVALRSSLRDSALPVGIAVAGVHRHSEAVELAVYFCCTEAVQNAAKHAGPGASVGIRLSEGEGLLRFVVEDDGRGFEPKVVRPGGGLANLVDRVAPLGGTIRIDSAPGRGTRIVGQIPV